VSLEGLQELAFSLFGSVQFRLLFLLLSFSQRLLIGLIRLTTTFASVRQEILLAKTTPTNDGGHDDKQKGIDGPKDASIGFFFNRNDEVVIVGHVAGKDIILFRMETAQKGSGNGFHLGFERSFDWKLLRSR
jgi:hypothetical protein